MRKITNYRVPTGSTVHEEKNRKDDEDQFPMVKRINDELKKVENHQSLQSSK